jgi:transglutaminase-like putative cysteine protease
MTINRRNVLIGGTALAGAAMLPRMAFAADAFIAAPGDWRDFEIVTRIDLASGGKAQAWIPVPGVNEPEWFKSLGNGWKTNAASAKIERDPVYGAEMVHLEWSAGEAPYAEIVSRISTRDRKASLDAPGNAAPLSEDDRKLYTMATDLIPIDGIVKETADRITAGAESDLDKAKAVYQWVIENTFRDPQTRGCGIGDVAGMLKSGNLQGKCADLNALFVGLVRAAGVPARDVYGIRIAPSKFGYKSLGAGSEIVTKAQHCRAEVYLDGLGWVAADPADVRKVVLEEPPKNLALDDPKVVSARNTLFGAWEGNWLAYNVAHDLVLPGSQGDKLPFLMYPQAETAEGLLDPLDPDAFRYEIKSREVTA